MRRIEKGAAPDCLGALENTPGANWNSVHGDQKQQLRDALYEAQLGLCAYCMSQLPGTNENDMTIEHFASRAVSPENTFQWPNLLGVCMGDIGIQGDGANRD